MLVWTLQSSVSNWYLRTAQTGSELFRAKITARFCVLLFKHVFCKSSTPFYLHQMNYLLQSGWDLYFYCTQAHKGCIFKVCFSNRCHVLCTLVLTACVYVWLSWQCRYIDSGANTYVRNTRDKGLSTCEMMSSEKARQPLLLIISKCTGSMTACRKIWNRFRIVCWDF